MMTRKYCFCCKIHNVPLKCTRPGAWIRSYKICNALFKYYMSSEFTFLTCNILLMVVIAQRILMWTLWSTCMLDVGKSTSISLCSNRRQSIHIVLCNNLVRQYINPHKLLVFEENWFVNQSIIMYSVINNLLMWFYGGCFY